MAESMEFYNMFEYHENLTLEEAVIAYQGIPAWRRNAGQGLEL